MISYPACHRNRHGSWGNILPAIGDGATSLHRKEPSLCTSVPRGGILRGSLADKLLAGSCERGVIPLGRALGTRLVPCRRGSSLALLPILCYWPLHHDTTTVLRSVAASSGRRSVVLSLRSVQVLRLPHAVDIAGSSQVLGGYRPSRRAAYRCVSRGCPGRIPKCVLCSRLRNPTLTHDPIPVSTVAKPQVVLRVDSEFVNPSCP